MARYTVDIVLNQPEDFVAYMVEDFCKKEGFKPVVHKGEQVYQAGGGMIEMPKFFIWSYEDGIFHMETWTKICWLPGIYGRKENALTGFYGKVPKKIYKKTVDDFIQLLQQPLSSQEADSYKERMNESEDVVYVEGVHNEKYAGIGLAFSIIGLILAFLLPLIGAIFALVGITYSNKAMHSTKRGLAIAGLVVGIIGTVAGFGFWIINFIMQIVMIVREVS